MKIVLSGICMSAHVLSGCATVPRSDLAPLQIQAFQTKEFEADKTIVFGSVISVFQDLGYIVQSADRDTGFITAASPAGNKTGFWEAMGGVSSSGNTKATAFVEQIRPNFSTIRLNFVDSKKLSAMYGQTSEQEKPILDPKPYQIAFDKIENAVFVRSGVKAPQPSAASSPVPAPLPTATPSP